MHRISAEAAFSGPCAPARSCPLEHGICQRFEPHPVLVGSGIDRITWRRLDLIAFHLLLLQTIYSAQILTRSKRLQASSMLMRPNAVSLSS